uniref:Uncharacterized protein n=1 Tax=Oryza nivara TaxID=4536 RepID=A0A2I4S652_ORYNI|nr:hypothetical protein NIV_5 [Oryza sativa f. spontanea]
MADASRPAGRLLMEMYDRRRSIDLDMQLEVQQLLVAGAHGRVVDGGGGGVGRSCPVEHVHLVVVVECGRQELRAPLAAAVGGDGNNGPGGGRRRRAAGRSRGGVVDVGVDDAAAGGDALLAVGVLVAAESLKLGERLVAEEALEQPLHLLAVPARGVGAAAAGSDRDTSSTTAAGTRAEADDSMDGI